MPLLLTHHQGTGNPAGAGGGGRGDGGHSPSGLLSSGLARPPSGWCWRGGARRWQAPPQTPVPVTPVASQGHLWGAPCTQQTARGTQLARQKRCGLQVHRLEATDDPSHCVFASLLALLAAWQYKLVKWNSQRTLYVCSFQYTLPTIFCVYIYTYFIYKSVLYM